jgi:predicted enzyme related to lactoylglutathione lyase
MKTEENLLVGFNVGGFELGLDPSDSKVTQGDNAHTYWGVQNIEESVAHCVSLKATMDSAIRDVGSNIKVATVRDPFGNIFGLIENPNFKVQSK